MVVKPLDFVLRGPKGLVQPALKCRGREYLRIIYGSEYTADDQLPKLRSRGLSGKRSLAPASSRSVLRPWSDSSLANLCDACTNAYSVY
jgi:PNKP adenylyltransferase domain, ligase domain